MTLRWEKQHSGSWYAYSGALVVGMVVPRDTGEVVYSVDAVHTRHITKGHGEVTSVPAAKRAIERAWSSWLDHAGLGPRTETA